MIIKLKNLVTEGIYNEPPEIKKRLGGRYGGEPEKAVADPGNLKQEALGDFIDSKVQGVVNDEPLKYAVNPVEEGINPKELINGIKVEMEHGKTVGWNAYKIVAIALDHLKEDPEYYTKLKTIHNDSPDMQKEFSARPDDDDDEIDEIGHKHKKWEPGQPFPKQVSMLIKKFASNDEAAISELSPRGSQHGLKFNKPKNGIWAYVWRLAKFRSGVDPRTPMRADWDLSDEIEKQTGWRVNFYAGDDPAQKAILKALDGQVNRVVKQLGLDPQGAARRWGRALGTPGSEEGGGGDTLNQTTEEPEEQPKKKEKEVERK